MSRPASQADDVKLEAIGRLARKVAHDLNNLLTVVLGLAGLLKMRSETDGFVQETAERIAQATERVADLATELADFAHHEDILPIPVDLQRMIEGVVEEVRVKFGAKIGITWHRRAGSVAVRGDLGRLQIAIRNLLTNAADAMPQGGEIYLATEVVGSPPGDDDRPHAGTPPARCVLISVTDGGCGIAEEVQGRIFEPYFSTKSTAEHAGLGLSMVYRIVKDHGGTVEFTSEAGSGSTFNLYFPLAGRAD